MANRSKLKSKALVVMAASGIIAFRPFCKIEGYEYQSLTASASIVSTQKYLKFMPQSIDLAASVSTRLAELAKVHPEPNNRPAEKALRLVNKRP